MSKRTEAKSARRKKRRAARDANWTPAGILDELSDAYADDIEVAAELERFDERITQRGWTFDEEFSEEGFASWFYAPSADEVDEPHFEPVTRICASANDNSDLPDGAPAFPQGVSVFFVGDAEIFVCTHDELFEHLDVIEGYRLDDPYPVLR